MASEGMPKIRATQSISVKWDPLPKERREALKASGMLWDYRLCNVKDVVGIYEVFYDENSVAWARGDTTVAATEVPGVLDDRVLTDNDFVGKGPQP